jgi:hypothetical protein
VVAVQAVELQVRRHSSILPNLIENAVKFRKIVPFGVSLAPKVTLVFRAVVLGLGLGIALPLLGDEPVVLVLRFFAGGLEVVLTLCLLGVEGSLSGYRYIEGRVVVWMRRHREGKGTGRGRRVAARR